MKVIKNIEYCNGQHLDIYFPEQKPFKTMIYFHGGGICSGNKDDETCVDLMTHLAKKGFMMVNVNYSLYPATKFPLFIEECAQSVKYVFEHASEYDINTKEIYISGQSAGAYIIMMLCLNSKYLNDLGIDVNSIRGFISDSGQMIDHFNVQHYELGIDPWLQRISEYSPIYFVEKTIKTPPILLIFYSDDMLNRKEQNMMLFNLIKFYNPNSDIEYVELPGGHVEGSTKLDKDNEYPYVKEVIRWTKQR